MSSNDIGAVALTFTILLLAVHSLGFIFQKLRQPRLIGEISAGILLGPSVLGFLAPDSFHRLFGKNDGDNKINLILNFIYWIGLFLLMFSSGSESRKLMAREDRAKMFLLLGVGTTLPFLLVFIFSPFIPISNISGAIGQEIPALIVLAIAATVMSIPVIARIFIDLKIVHTRFASLMLSVAVLEDIVLWGALAAATSLSKVSLVGAENPWPSAIQHIGVTFLYMIVGLFLAPRAVQWLHNWRWNFLLKASAVGYLFFFLFLYATIAAILDVNLVFAAFLAGFGVVGGMAGTSHERFIKHLDPLARVSSGFFIPIYFAMVGFKLSWGSSFSFSLFVLFLVGSSLLSILSFGFAAYMSGFRGLDIANLAITKNARGGPGIVLATVAYETGIINAAFCSTLVLTALLTSQVAGAWLAFVIKKGWPLLSDQSPANKRNRELEGQDV